MRRALLRFVCWLRDHPAVTVVVQVKGRIAYITYCRCGRREPTITGRAFPYPLRRRG